MMKHHKKGGMHEMHHAKGGMHHAKPYKKGGHVKHMAKPDIAIMMGHAEPHAEPDGDEGMEQETQMRRGGMARHKKMAHHAKGGMHHAKPKHHAKGGMHHSKHHAKGGMHHEDKPIKAYAKGGHVKKKHNINQHKMMAMGMGHYAKGGMVKDPYENTDFMSMRDAYDMAMKEPKKDSRGLF